MPNAYLKSLVDQGKGSMQHLEAEWEKAKKNASEQGQGDNYAYITEIFKTRIGASMQNIEQAALKRLGITADTIDVVKMDIPFLIRLLEWAHEDAKTDVEIHSIVTRILEASKGGEVTIDMEHYKSIVEKNELR